jgi:hypothetical protein
MSLLQNATNFASRDPYFLLANQSTITFQTIQANNVSTGILQAGVTIVDQVNATSISSQFINCTSTLSTFFLEADTAYISSIYNSGINLDGQELTANATDLLLNGVPIATTANLSSIQDWAIFPAVSTVNFSLNSLVSCNQIRAQNIFCQNLIASNSIVDQFTSTLYISSQVIEVSSLTATEANILVYLTAPAIEVSSLVSNNTSSGFLYFGVGNGNTLNVNTLSTGSLLIGDEVADNLSTLSLQFGSATGNTLAVNSLSSGTAFISQLSVSSISGTSGGSGFASEWARFPATSNVNMNGFNITSQSSMSITVPSGGFGGSNLALSGGDVNIVADEGSLISAFSDVNITAQNGNRGRVNITANGGFNNGVFGEVNLVANGATLGPVGSGGLINLTANSPIGFSNLTSAIKFSAAGINSYAGAIPSIGSLAGYNFIYGNAGVNICAGLPSVIPSFPLTTYIYGTNGVSLDGINTVEVKATLGFESGNNNYFNSIFPFWTGLATPPDLLIAGRYIAPNFAQVYVTLSNVKWIDFDSTAALSNVSLLNFGSNGRITNVSSIVGTANSAASLGTVSAGTGNFSSANIANRITGTIANAQILGFSTVQTNNLLTNTINGLPIAGFTNISSFASASISSATISTINGLPISEFTNASTFQTASISSASISSINGIAVNNFLNTNTFSTASISTASISTLNSLQSSINVVSSDPFSEPLLQVQQLYGLSTVGQFIADGANVIINANLPSLGYEGSGNIFLNAEVVGINQEPGNVPGSIYCDISGNTQIENGYLKVATGSSASYSILTSNSLETETVICSTLTVSSITVGSINNYPYPWTSTLAGSASTFVVDGTLATTPQLLGQITFPYAGDYFITQKVAFTKLTGGSSQNCCGCLILDGPAIFPTFPAGETGLAALPTINENSASTFTTLVSNVGLVSTLTKNIYYYDATGNNYTASLHTDLVVIHYNPGPPI